MTPILYSLFEWSQYVYTVPWCAGSVYCVLTVYRSKSNIFQLWQVCFSVLIPASYPSFSSIVTGEENALDFPTFTWIEFSLQINNLIWYQFTFLSPMSLALQVSIHWRFSHPIFYCRHDSPTIFNIWADGAVEYKWTMDNICTESVLVLIAIVSDDAAPSLIPQRWVAECCL